LTDEAERPVQVADVVVVVVDAGYEDKPERVGREAKRAGDLADDRADVAGVAHDVQEDGLTVEHLPVPGVLVGLLTLRGDDWRRMRRGVGSAGTRSRLARRPRTRVGVSRSRRGGGSRRGPPSSRATAR